jgi:hypothetical protein
MTVEDEVKKSNKLLKELNDMISKHLGHKKEIPQPYFFWLEAAIMGLLAVWFTLDLYGGLLD